MSGFTSLRYGGKLAGVFGRTMRAIDAISERADGICDTWSVLHQLYEFLG